MFPCRHVQIERNTRKGLLAFANPGLSNKLQGFRNRPFGLESAESRWTPRTDIRLTATLLLGSLQRSMYSVNAFDIDGNGYLKRHRPNGSLPRKVTCPGKVGVFIAPNSGEMEFSLVSQGNLSFYIISCRILLALNLWCPRIVTFWHFYTIFANNLQTTHPTEKFTPNNIKQH